VAVIAYGVLWHDIDSASCHSVEIDECETKLNGMSLHLILRIATMYDSS